MKEYTRGEVIKSLGIGKTTLRRWEESGKAKPRRNERGIALYTEAEVRRLGKLRNVEMLPKAREALPDPAKVDGAQAAKIFAALDRGVSTVQIVIELELHPDVVEAFLVQWARMKGMVIVSEKTLAEITALPGFFGTSIESEEQLFSGFRSSLRHAPALCAACREEHSRICLECRRREHAQIRAETEKRVRAEYEGGAEDEDAVERERPVVVEGRRRRRRRHPDATFRTGTPRDRAEAGRVGPASSPAPRTPSVDPGAASTGGMSEEGG